MNDSPYRFGNNSVVYFFYDASDRWKDTSNNFSRRGFWSSKKSMDTIFYLIYFSSCFMINRDYWFDNKFFYWLSNVIFNEFRHRFNNLVPECFFVAVRVVLVGCFLNLSIFPLNSIVSIKWIFVGIFFSFLFFVE